MYIFKLPFSGDTVPFPKSFKMFTSCAAMLSNTSMSAYANKFLYPPNQKSVIVLFYRNLDKRTLENSNQAFNHISIIRQEFIRELSFSIFRTHRLLDSRYQPEAVCQHVCAKFRMYSQYCK